MSFLAGLIPTLATKVGEFAGNLLEGKGFGDALEATTSDIPIIGSVVKAGNKFFDSMDKKYPPRAGYDKWGYPVAAKPQPPRATINPPKYGRVAPESDDETDDDDDDEIEVGSIDPLGNNEPMRFKGADPNDVIRSKGNRLQRNVQMLKKENDRLRGLVRRYAARARKPAPALEPDGKQSLAKEVRSGLGKFGRFV